MMLSNFVIGIKLYNWLQLEIKNGFLEVTHIHGLESKLEIKFKTLEDFKNIFECKHIKKSLCSKRKSLGLKTKFFKSTIWKTKL